MTFPALYRMRESGIDLLIKKNPIDTWSSSPCVVNISSVAAAESARNQCVDTANAVRSKCIANAYPKRSQCIANA